jgi:hypothetical protein
MMDEFFELELRLQGRNMLYDIIEHASKRLNQRVEAFRTSDWLLSGPDRQSSAGNGASLHSDAKAPKMSKAQYLNHLMHLSDETNQAAAHAKWLEKHKHNSAQEIDLASLHPKQQVTANDAVSAVEVSEKDLLFMHFLRMFIVSVSASHGISEEELRAHVYSHCTL